MSKINIGLLSIFGYYKKLMKKGIGNQDAGVSKIKRKTGKTTSKPKSKFKSKNFSKV